MDTILEWNLGSDILLSVVMNLLNRCCEDTEEEEVHFAKALMRGNKTVDEVYQEFKGTEGKKQDAVIYEDKETNTENITKLDVGTNTVPRRELKRELKRTYADVASSTEVSSRMDVDPPTQVQHIPAPTKKKPQKPQRQHPAKPTSHAKAIVVHGINTNANLSRIIREVEGQTRRLAMGARWLLSKERREGKKASSVVVFFYDYGGRECTKGQKSMSQNKNQIKINPKTKKVKIRSVHANKKKSVYNNKKINYIISSGS
jgi:hypothetical protein